MLDCRNTRGYTLGGHARDRSRDRRLRIVHSLQLVQITQYLYNKQRTFTIVVSLKELKPKATNP